METNKEITIRKRYFSPNMEQILIDNDIALALASSPPAGPSEVNVTPTQLSNNPFRIDNA